jgi:hypothetical protein
MLRRLHPFAASFLLLAAVVPAAAVACGSSSESTFSGGPDGGSVGFGDSGVLPPPTAGDPPPRCNPCNDFPSPIMDPANGGPPANAAALFGAAPSGTPANNDPCLVEPEPGAIYPRNWLRPRVRWTTAGSADLFEIRFKVANQTSDLVVYTKAKEWKMDKALWDLLRDHSWDTDITMTVRGGRLEGAALTGVVTSGGAIRIAPVQAPGSVVYWRIRGYEASELRGFRIGDETVVDALKPEQVKQRPAGACVGCHASTPDGNFVAFGVDDGEHGNSIASVTAGTAGEVPPWLGSAAAKLMIDKAVHTAPAFTRAHWGDGDRKVLMAGPNDDVSGGGEAKLYSINLESTDDATVRTEIVRTGDPNKPIMPTWSHDGQTVVYVSTTKIHDSRVDGTGDLYSVPYNNGAGGNATKFSGAAETTHEELYPAFSPDDRWLTFTRVKAEQWDDRHFSNKFSEVFVIPATGGTPTRLAANDPPMCSGKVSPGVTNSWSRWSPEAVAHEGKTYYWLVFSSNRQAEATHQLYVAPVIVDGAGSITTGSALYLWNQPADQSNHTPAWDVFKIPPAPVN